MSMASSSLNTPGHDPQSDDFEMDLKKVFVSSTSSAIHLHPLLGSRPMLQPHTISLENQARLKQQRLANSLESAALSADQHYEDGEDTSCPVDQQDPLSIDYTSENLNLAQTNRFSKDAVRLLIATAVPLRRKKKGRNGAKIKLWEMVAQRMKDNGHPITPDACRKKFCYLLSRFKETKHQSSIGSQYSLSFEYTHDFEEAFTTCESTDDVDIPILDNSIDFAQEEVEKPKPPKESFSGGGSRVRLMTCFEERQLQIMQKEFKMKERFLKQIVEIEEKKLELLQTMCLKK